MYNAAMPPNRFDALTPTERTVLRSILSERDQKGVARSLGISPETVKTHLRNAREKCGFDTSFALAKAFAVHEGSPPRWGIPLDGGRNEGSESGIEVPPLTGEFDGVKGEEVREPRVSFVYDTPLPAEARRIEREPRSQGLHRMLAILGIVLLLIVVIILAFPLSESFQRLANEIDPPTR